MPIRYLKTQDGREICGKNNKKLRYEINGSSLIVKFVSNWTKESLNILKETNENYEIIYENKKRGRPKQKGEKMIERKQRSELKNSAAVEYPRCPRPNLGR